VRAPAASASASVSGPDDETTLLQRQLERRAPGDQAAKPGSRGNALAAFHLARQRFQEGERVDMSALAAELGVNRVTLYRWVGSREKLLVEILWSLASPTLERERSRTRKRGAPRVVQIVSRFVAAVLANPGMSRFLAEEGELAMRLLTRRDAGFQPRLIEAVETLLREEVARGTLDIPADLHDVAYTVVRIIESYVYLDRITGEEPDAARAESILGLLLR
jgi:AcrR family transcriptional regulator